MGKCPDTSVSEHKINTNLSDVHVLSITTSQLDKQYPGFFTNFPRINFIFLLLMEQFNLIYLILHSKEPCSFLEVKIKWLILTGINVQSAKERFDENMGMAVPLRWKMR